MEKTENTVSCERKEESRVSPRFETGSLVTVGVTDRRKVGPGFHWWGEK